MAFELLMPKMGESVQEATITKWFVKENDTIEEEDELLEISTDKVDSEIPSPVDGTIQKIYYKENDKIPVGEVIALIDTEGEAEGGDETEKSSEDQKGKEDTGEATEAQPDSSKGKAKKEDAEQKTETSSAGKTFSESKRFYSPLVKNIARKENISVEELESITGTGYGGRVRKNDILKYVADKKEGKIATGKESAPGKKEEKASAKKEDTAEQAVKPSVNAEDDIQEMSRIRKLIADHMVTSQRVSPHVTNIIEADVTNIVKWRDSLKDDFYQKENEKLTFMPVFIEATAKALRDFPGVNVSVDGYNIIYRKNINIGIAVAKPDGNLIVPVIKNADQKNLLGLTKETNRLANAARNNKLNPDEIAGGTFSISNFGSFKNLTGTPIINQPEVAILATGTIEKKPAVIETEDGDIVGIRHKMFLSLTYDHRAVDGALGGAFLKRITDYLENFDKNTTIV